ncbi:MAG: ATP-binding protein, partial [Methylococcaceae bacterium]
GQIEPIYLEPYSGDYYQVFANGQVIRSRSLLNQDISIQALSPGEKRKLYSTGPKLQPLLVMVHGYSKLDRNITIAVAEDISSTLARITTFQHRFTLISLILLLLLIIVQAIILRSGFHRLTRISQQIRALEQGKRTQLDSDVPQEVAALVHEVNWLLKVMDQRLQRSRNALGDLAHALKTPLTVLQQLPREAALKSQPEICCILQTQTTNMQNIMERVLKRARMAGSGPAVIMFDIKQEIPALIKALQSMYRDKNLSISFVAPEAAMLLIDREDMLELTGNLLDNACKWAKSRVSLSFDINRIVHLIVEDDGPGVSDADFAMLTQRGTRLDEAVNGHGLGLSIAQSIVEQYGGQLILRRSNKLGGFCVEARFSKSEPF